MSNRVDLVVPVKVLLRAKSRLLGAADNGAGDRTAHERLALALVTDTMTAARAAERVRRLLAITSDPNVAEVLTGLGVETVPDVPGGLNAALAYGADLLRQDHPAARIGALQADLPALRPEELDAALAAAPERAFVPDRQGTGTTLLLAGLGPLDPRFGPGSATAHAASGAAELLGPWPSLRCDVDTAEDLIAAAALGLGEHTARLLAPAA
ncbi:2-phospho-L-lactate guanylyltransferase [Crossiella sp. CA-258035]|uniref:2-phospho-L-lactate guanylyltransferase n=1 Tax=Crossiella sp. CA-258035 TaxID=2981138 RepID=UPI0024BC1207|nr:2-phospho-L-lactate guanylyltransferase [Crossiella sp. CA-258035]WHT18128.1 2-phospho-L-lactate guanylyltransferase [Crossiella sp. CA-258035]